MEDVTRMKKKEVPDLYFIALLPDEPVFSEVIKLKEEIRDRFGSKAALRSPPHITLHMPFKWKAEKEEMLFQTLEKIAKDHNNLTLDASHFGTFEPRVIYVNIIESASLKVLQKQVARRAASDWHIYPMRSSRPFKPHMTIGFRDLKKPKFYEAWDEFQHRKYKASFKANDITLLKHNGKSWEVYRQFKFEN